MGTKGKVVELIHGKKECTECNVFKELEDFYKKITGPHGRTNMCKKCTSASRKQKHVPKKREDKTLLTQKKCSKCKMVKIRKEFRVEKRNANQMSSRCKECMIEDAKEKRPDKQKTEKEKLLINGLKKCFTCLKIKKLNDFGNRLLATDKKQGSCLECARSAEKEWCLKNPDAWRNKYKNQNAKRRAMKLNIENTFPKNWWSELITFYGPYCMYPNCDKEIDDTNHLTHDHIIPLSDTERSSNSLLNSQILCRSHNSGKNSHHSTDYRDWTKGILLDDLTIIYDKIEPTKENLFKLQGVAA